MKSIYNLLLSTLFFSLFANNLVGQTCGTCSAGMTYSSGTININNLTSGADVICITGTVTISSINNLGEGGDQICITSTGRLTWNSPNINNGSLLINVQPGGVYNDGSGSWTGKITLNNGGTANFTNTAGLTLQGNPGNTINNLQGATLNVNSTTTSKILINGGSTINNNSIINSGLFEVAEGTFSNTTIATLNVVGEANIHADGFSSAGRINAGSLVFTNKPGDGPEFFGTSCTVISGNISIDAQVIFNGYLETTNGSVTFSSIGKDNGTGGILVVRSTSTSTNSSIQAGGYYKGDFYDNDNNGGFTTTPGQPVTAASHGFDVLQILSQGQNVNNINVLTTLPIICSSSVVPIILSKFTAIKSGTQSTLNWVTASEENAAFIEVERSITGIDEYVTLGKLEARNVPGQYTFTDSRPNFGHNYYRLKLVDLDETYKYSGIQLVTFADPINELSVYPNPFNDQINIKGTFIGDEVTVYGLDGKILQKISMKSNEAVINGSNMANGIYLIVIKSGADIKYFKIIKSY